MAENAFLWDVTASNNDDADAAVPWPEGMLPGSVNNSSRGIMAAVARLIKDLNGTVTSGGLNNNYTLTSSSGHTAYTNGILVSFKASFTNSGDSNLDLNSIGNRKISTFGASGEQLLVAGQIRSGCTYQFRYDSALDSGNGAFLLLNPTVDPIGPGSIKIWTSDTLEPGWLWCDGDAVSQTTYAGLFAVVGTQFNFGGEGAGNFRVPDLRGRAPFGKNSFGGGGSVGLLTVPYINGDDMGAAGGSQSVTLDATQIPAITPAGSVSVSGSVTFSSTGNNNYTPAGTNASSSITGGSTVNIPVFPTGGGGGTTRLLSDTATGLNATFGVTGTAAAQIFTGSSVSVSWASSSTGFTGTSFGGGLAHSNLPPALILNFVIKY